MIQPYYDHSNRVRCGACNALVTEGCACSIKLDDGGPRYVYRIEVLDEGTWCDSGEGPWDTADGAFDFAETEVGLAWRVVREWADQPPALLPKGGRS